MTALIALTQADTVPAWDPADRTLIAASVIGTMPWIKRSQAPGSKLIQASRLARAQCRSERAVVHRRDPPHSQPPSKKRLSGLSVVNAGRPRLRLNMRFTPTKTADFDAEPGPRRAP